MEKEFSCRKGAYLMVNSKIICLKAREYSKVKAVKDIKANGFKTKNMELVAILGPMEINMKALTSKVRDKDMER
jgi:hypothetical protein